ncbi:MAG TPA: sugar phosphate nucleotidyltransferase [Candidatus Paceibacterota bacterium]
MKGVILAGGTGTRLRPFTHVTNKHLLPVYDKPVIFHAVAKLVDAGIDRIMIVTSPDQVSNFVKILGSGQDLVVPQGGKQIQIVYGIQNEPGGLAQGLYIAKEYVGDDNCVFYLGDNIFEDDFEEHIRNFKTGAVVFLKKVTDPERYGVATIDTQGRVLGIEEKPQIPKSNMAVTGLYIYDNTVFDKMINQPKSERGEYEITYVNNKYIEDRALRSVELLNNWFDVGTTDSLLEAGKFIQHKRQISSRVPSLSIVFSCYNNKGTIATMVLEAKKVARSITEDFEIIVVDDYSTDGSQELLIDMKTFTPELKLVFHHSKQGYGASLKSGFGNSSKDIICYTDGDAQYDIREFPKLLEKFEKNVDLVSGYKVRNLDPFHRVAISFIYTKLMKLIFWLPFRDPDCDFRMLRRGILDKINLESDSGVISVELLKKAVLANCAFAEVGVTHQFRMYGKSQALNATRIVTTLWLLIKLRWDTLRS